MDFDMSAQDPGMAHMGVRYLDTGEKLGNRCGYASLDDAVAGVNKATWEAGHAAAIFEDKGRYYGHQLDHQAWYSSAGMDGMWGYQFPAKLFPFVGSPAVGPIGPAPGLRAITDIFATYRVQ